MIKGAYMEKAKKPETGKLYTTHGKKMPQGKMGIINGEKVLAYFDGEDVVGYSTQDEINREFYTRDLPNLSVNF